MISFPGKTNNREWGY